ncbi:MAG: pyridoxamine 5'-phosphate oxidase family protein [Chloroflexi bacterium]|nr:pyridoxamine 5'-phosphate oxidase family protein [Chloroflexota bacterium]
MSEPQRSRPLMKHYGVSDKDDGMMAWQWVDEQMRKARNYWICSARPDGRPHVAPVWGVWHEGTLYFGSSRTSRKGRNIAHNAHVAIHLESGDDTVIFEGVLEEVADSALLAALTSIYREKYAMNDVALSSTGDSVCYALRPEMALSWLEKDFPNTATRWQFGTS